jgi:hypothetical protein
MALFSLLVAILVERLKLLPSGWQFDSVMTRYQKKFWDSQSLKSAFSVAMAIVLPALLVFVLVTNHYEACLNSISRRHVVATYKLVIVMPASWIVVTV